MPSRGTTTPAYSVRLAAATSTIRNTARNNTPSYPLGPGNSALDLQTTPALDTTAAIFTSDSESPILRVLARVWSPGGTPVHAAVFATSLYNGAVVQMTPTLTFTSTLATILDLGAFQLPEFYTATLRIWSDGTAVPLVSAAPIRLGRPARHVRAKSPTSLGAPHSKLSAPAAIISGGVVSDLIAYYRPTIFLPVNYIDPLASHTVVVAAPAYGPPQNVTQETQTTTTGVDLDFQPVIAGIPGPSQNEFVALASIRGVEPQPLAAETVWTGRWYVSGVTAGVGGIGGGGDPAIPHSRFVVAPADPLYIGPPLSYNQNVATIAGPGDTFAIQAAWTNGFGGDASMKLYQSEIILSLGVQALRVTCDLNGRSVSYAGPMPSAITHYEARVYYSNNGVWQFLESLGTITANPYLFPILPAFDAAAHSGDASYVLVIRAYYPDGSWVQNGCRFTPRADNPVFRIGHKVAS